MRLPPGVRLGAYEIQSALGAGGMGEVYRARDTKLNRDVALKVLPERFAQDPDRLARFTREAQLLASLNHPNIASIYGLEETVAMPSSARGEPGPGAEAVVRALVLELVEGPTLADRLASARQDRGQGLPLEEALVEPAGAAAGAPVPAPRTRERLWWAGALIVALAGSAAGTARYLGVRPAQASEVRFEITTPPTADPASLAVSPDGKRLVFVGSSDGKSRLWLRSLDEIAARPLAGTENARFPFWSPDSQSVGFASDGQLKRIDIATGFVRMVTAHIAYGGTWNEDGTILFGGGPGSPVYRVSADGGTWRELTQIDSENSYHRSPQFLPDQRHFLFHVSGSAQGIYVGDLETGKAHRLLDADAAVYGSGHLLFVRQGTLLAQPFDPAQQQLAGSPTAVVQQVLVRGQGVAALSASAAGSIVFRSGPPGAEGHFVWFDRSGKVLETIAGSDGPGFNSALSPDGRWLALNKVTNGNRDLWLLELSRGVSSRFTSDAAFELIPVWSPDGRQLAFSSNRRGTMDVYVKPVVGLGSDELVVAIDGVSDVPSDWSPDGQFLLYSTDDKDIWALPMRGDRKAFPVVQAAFAEVNGQFSPDGRWIAYQSNESGQFEIYVQRFPGPGPKTLVSSDGGDQVRWRQDGRELFYLAPDNGLMAVPIRLDESGDRVQVGAPALLFSPSLSGSPRYRPRDTTWRRPTASVFSWTRSKRSRCRSRSL